MRIVSLNTKVKQICGLADGDLNFWEQDFVGSIEEKTQNGKDVSNLTDSQINVIERIWDKHFA